MKKLLVLLIACLALTLAACGGDDDDDGGDSGNGGADVTTQAPADDDEGGGAPAGGETVDVDIPSISFEPAEVTVPAGSTIVWTNSDDLPHTVTKDGGPGGDFDSGNIEPGGTFELTADVAGTVDYVCTIHPGQAGSFTVE
ncbi:MAG TPA: cupredoxin family copper-binding protein [Thermoleophilaceae bacterium]|nr:cupredoxin family copper-binding protein [Thermoleophilaceae bacterium]